MRCFIDIFNIIHITFLVKIKYTDRDLKTYNEVEIFIYEVRSGLFEGSHIYVESEKGLKGN